MKIESSKLMIFLTPWRDCKKASVGSVQFVETQLYRLKIFLQMFFKLDAIKNKFTTLQMRQIKKYGRVKIKNGR